MQLSPDFGVKHEKLWYRLSVAIVYTFGQTQVCSLHLHLVARRFFVVFLFHGTWILCFLFEEENKGRE